MEPAVAEQQLRAGSLEAIGTVFEIKLIWRQHEVWWGVGCPLALLIFSAPNPPLLAQGRQLAFATK